MECASLTGKDRANGNGCRGPAHPDTGCQARPPTARGMTARDTGTLSNVYLVGPMGSGKTTLGRRTAAELGMNFFDCDEEIEKFTGASVNLIFDIEGEDGFRERESRMLHDLCDRNNALVATGGGVVLSAENRALLRKSGVVVWLRATVGQQLRRLELDRKRPLLQAPDRRERLERLAAERDPLYEAAADLTFTSGGRNLHQVTAALAKAIRDFRAEGTGDEPEDQRHAQR